MATSNQVMRQYGQLQTELKFQIKKNFLDLELALTVRLTH